MVNIVWALMAIIGILYAMVNGTMDQVNEAIFDSAADTITLVISLCSVLIFWLGMMRIAEKAGLLNGLSKLFRPIVKKLFPEIPDNHPAMGYILANFSANLFGLGNAATPMGIKAMHELKKLEGTDKASNSMITFLIINTSSITLIPTTVIAIRMQYGSANPTEIVGSTILASICTTIAAIMIDRYLRSKRKVKHRNG
ncbi:spore maturation protein A [Gracilibacillus halotolerans]|uniref:Spore maturation protein A n=1 Tax=Gracilibacillus halotolerans TaxID=74386 RepID=A0A841RCL5_9BACI|nr:nucleoside recognition domain-containing protein [Gracilibacillus halotolerans]MBB6511690.1 spore maturation protein A [Gracilibacillus halotolerans]